MDTLTAAGIIGALTLAISLAGFRVRWLIERNLLRPFWLLPRREYWTLISNGLVHADGSHLLFNAISYWAFAFPLERRIGSLRFVLLYLTGQLASSLGTYFKHRRDPNYACLGASGAILAVLFASVVYFPKNGIMMLPIPVPIPAPLFAVLYLAYSFYAARRARGRINHDAHFDGALAGLAFVAITDFGAWQRAWQLLTAAHG